MMRLMRRIRAAQGEERRGPQEYRRHQGPPGRHGHGGSLPTTGLRCQFRRARLLLVLAKMADLGQRARQILYAAISEFVATGEPVGSRTLSKKHGIDLSPASIRNVLSDLEEWGYLHQPHTSAGRIPTDRAFRLFIDALMEWRELSAEDHARIRERFDDLTPGKNVMRETGKLLSELTGTAAVVITPRGNALTLKHLRFVRIQQDEVLAVLV